MNVAEINLSRRQANVSARECLNIILANLEKLRLKDRGGKMEKAAVEFDELLKRGLSLTPNQYSYINGIYERLMDNAGFGGAGNVHKGNKRRALRYG
jgi:hypothetical protein